MYAYVLYMYNGWIIVMHLEKNAVFWSTAIGFQLGDDPRHPQLFRIFPFFKAIQLLGYLHLWKPPYRYR